MSVNFFIIIVAICLACFVAIYRRKKFDALIFEMTSISTDINQLTSELTSLRGNVHDKDESIPSLSEEIIDESLLEYIICAKGIKNNKAKDKYILLAMQGSLLLENGSIRNKIVENFSERKRPILNFDEDMLDYRHKAIAYPGKRSGACPDGIFSASEDGQRAILREAACI